MVGGQEGLARLLDPVLDVPLPVDPLDAGASGPAFSSVSAIAVSIMAPVRTRNVNASTAGDYARFLQMLLNVPYLKSLLAFPTFMPVRKDIVENADGTPNDKWTLDPKKFVSNGMYKLSKRVQDDVIEMVANGYYHDKATVKVPKLIFKLFSDDTPYSRPSRTTSCRSSTHTRSTSTRAS